MMNQMNTSMTPFHRMCLLLVSVVLLLGTSFIPFQATDQDEHSESGYHLVAKSDSLQATVSRLYKTYHLGFFLKWIVILSALLTLRFYQTLLPRFTQTNSIQVRMRSLFLMPLKFNSNFVIL